MLVRRAGRLDLPIKVMRLIVLSVGRKLISMTDYPAKKKKLSEKPKLCEECYVNYADPPSKLCPGCQAYKEHQK